MIKKYRLIILIVATLVVAGLVYLKTNNYYIYEQLRQTATKGTTDITSNGAEVSEEQGTEDNKGAGQMEQSLVVQKIIIDSDKDKDEILDLEDFVQGARMEAKNKPLYRSEYYMGGYPPEHEGVCTDVIWRSFKNAGYNLKDMIDKDIKEHTADYQRVEGRPDTNIDFRRVPNQLVFFRKYAAEITNELKPNDADNLKHWQGGDIVVFSKPDHIAIISDIRRKDGVPFIIHNSGPYAKEDDNLEMWMADDGIVGHFRFPKSN